VTGRQHRDFVPSSLLAPTDFVVGARLSNDKTSRNDLSQGETTPFKARQNVIQRLRRPLS
jgi:hypothetical protein